MRFLTTVAVALALTGCATAAEKPDPDKPSPSASEKSTPSVRYRTCADAPGPLHRGDPGYRPGLDRDGDGVACDG